MQLDKLANVNAPPEAKMVIAEQSIRDAGVDAGQWMKYFTDQLSQLGSSATQPVQPVVG